MPYTAQAARSDDLPAPALESDWNVFAGGLPGQYTYRVLRVRHGSKDLCLAIPNQPLPSNSDVLVARTSLILFLTFSEK